MRSVTPTRRKDVFLRKTKRGRAGLWAGAVVGGLLIGAILSVLLDSLEAIQRTPPPRPRRMLPISSRPGPSRQVSRPHPGPQAAAEVRGSLDWLRAATAPTAGSPSEVWEVELEGTDRSPVVPEAAEQGQAPSPGGVSPRV